MEISCALKPQRVVFASVSCVCVRLASLSSVHALSVVACFPACTAKALWYGRPGGIQQAANRPSQKRPKNRGKAENEKRAKSRP